MKPSYIVKRLQPGSDLKESLAALVREYDLSAAAVVSLVGSLTVAALRLAGSDSAKVISGPLEIVSATGTLSASGMHIHLAVADSNGQTIGGHLLDGCAVYTTCEIVLVNMSHEWVFGRTIDENTGYLELKASRSASCNEEGKN